MCGAALEIAPNSLIAACDYCGSQQTLPRLNDEKIERLYDKANHFRRNNEFDKAMGIYEQILDENSEDAEVYWSMVLCRYGIEYVEDAATGKRTPTVHRVQYTSIFDDDNYKLALRYADFSQKGIYEKEAAKINQIQKGILEISQREEPFDVFICYKEKDANGQRTHDSVYANELYHELTQQGFKVFFARITLEDKLGTAYEPYIFAALNSAKVMVVLGTKPEYFNATWVRNEWSRYLALIKNGEKKVLIPAYRDMDAYDLPVEFSHLQAQDMNKLGFMPDLVRGINKIVGARTPQQMPVNHYTEPEHPRGADTEKLLKRVELFLEGSDWSNADIYCEKVLDADPENARAYIYKLLAQIHGSKEEDLILSNKPLDGIMSYKNALRFADEETSKRLIEYNRIVKESLEAQERKRIALEQERERARQEKERLRNERNALESARNNTANLIGAQVREKEQLEDLIERKHFEAQSVSNHKKLRNAALCVLWMIPIFALCIVISLVTESEGDGSVSALIAVLPIVVYIIFSFRLIKVYDKPGILYILVFFTYGILPIILALFALGKSKKTGAHYANEIAQLQVRLQQVEAHLNNSRQSLSELNQKLAESNQKLQDNWKAVNNR